MTEYKSGMEHGTSHARIALATFHVMEKIELKKKRKWQLVHVKPKLGHGDVRRPRKSRSKYVERNYCTRARGFLWQK